MFTSPKAEQATTEKNPLPDNLTEEKIDLEIKEVFRNESGLERVKSLFKYDETAGQRPNFLIENIDILTSVGVSGFILGSILKVNESSESFKRNNQLALYTDKKAATRAYVDYIYLQTVKGGTKTALKFILFSGIIIGSSMAIEAYRNKTTPFDFTIGGAISGGIFRMHHGIPNLVAGSVAGSIFGTVFGLVRYTQMKLMEMTYEERRYKELREKIIIREKLLSSIHHEEQQKKS
ncbi:unnamed protein product [Brachionus calyciflorus]|uniref:Complex I assembly factor TIMMDC1, mitochondrial n=1 Tax=Brachionus calyciflorus TaxID=104777 RepID=A0A813M3D9_9BILA|nr:unnamed protein product [Brachionus calyciflorus]